MSLTVSTSMFLRSHSGAVAILVRDRDAIKQLHMKEQVVRIKRVCDRLVTVTWQRKRKHHVCAAQHKYSKEIGKISRVRHPIIKNLHEATIDDQGQGLQRWLRCQYMLHFRSGLQKLQAKAKVRSSVTRNFKVRRVGPSPTIKSHSHSLVSPLLKTLHSPLPAKDLNSSHSLLSVTM